MFTAFAITIFIQVAYYLYFFRRLADHHPAMASDTALPPVSVVICAHDELNGLRKNLPSILEQKYPEFEVIVVNDNSQDDTEMALKQMESKYPNLVLRTLQNSSQMMRGKKYPLTIGIRAARYDQVLLTDADCAPSSDRWIREMASAFSDEKVIVLGYAPYRRHSGFLNKFIRFECVITAMSYLSLALAGKPYMGVGRNLAYGKRVFFDHNIYSRYPELLSGDDDLLINEAATASNTTIQVNSFSFMYSEPKMTWDEYWHQKRRHVSTARYYQRTDQLLLGGYALTHLATYVLAAVVLFYSHWWPEGLLLLALRMGVIFITLRTIMKRLVEDDLIPWIPLLDFLHLIYYLKMTPSVYQSGRRTWK